MMFAGPCEVPSCPIAFCFQYSFNESFGKSNLAVGAMVFLAIVGFLPDVFLFPYLGFSGIRKIHRKSGFKTKLSRFAGNQGRNVPFIQKLIYGKVIDSSGWLR